MGGEIEKGVRAYSGQWMDDRCHGKGWFQDGESSYFGFWEKGQKSGQGFEVWHRDGTCYLGQHKQNNKWGQGIYSWEDGTRYTGEFEDDVISGQGVFVDAEGVYEGQFLRSLQHGRGVYKYAGGMVYMGQFLEGERHGRGKMIWPDGSEYDGEWSHGKQSGAGMEKLPNGE